MSSQNFEIKVSVIVPIYNGEKDLPSLLNGLLSQTYPSKKVEYILVDNNSKDKTAKLIHLASQEYKASGFNIKYINENMIQSSYAARNKGIQSSDGDILAFTDVDCCPHKNWISDVVEIFHGQPSVGLIGGSIVANKGSSIIEKYSEFKQILNQKNSGNHGFCPYASTANLSVRREVFEKVGLFRPHLTTGGDADFCWRVQRETNWQLYVTDQAVIEHRHRRSIGELKSQFRRYGKSHKYLEEIYGEPIFPPSITQKEYFDGWKYWFLRDFPRGIKRLLLGKGNLLDLSIKPIDLLTAHEEMLGRTEASLPDKGNYIKKLE
jgi:cellulose synthase/poly-beta-1,6-N-acetylglucosamine synthase-like glycosyltransferase